MADRGGADFWDERFGAGPAAFGDGPDPFFAEQATALGAGATALMPGDGEGRNGVWLATRGLQVTAVDLSPVGIEQARRRATAAGVAMEALVVDLAEWEWPEAAFDMVAAIFLHLPPAVRPAIHRHMLKAVRPGGMVLIRAFTPPHLALRAAGVGRGGPPDAALLYDPEMLRADFAGAVAEHLVEREVELPEARLHGGRGAVVEARFRRR